MKKNCVTLTFVWYKMYMGQFFSLMGLINKIFYFFETNYLYPKSNFVYFAVVLTTYGTENRELSEYYVLAFWIKLCSITSKCF